MVQYTGTINYEAKEGKYVPSEIRIGTESDKAIFKTLYWLLV